MKPCQKNKILILSGALGEGHAQAAKALYEASGLYAPDAEAEVIDFMKWTHPYLAGFGAFCYLTWIKSFPSMYGYLFQKTRADNPYSLFLKRMQLFNLEKLRKLLQQVNPTVVVHTFPSSAAAMSLLKAHGLSDLPSVTVITDHTDHSYWIHEHTDHYLVSSEHVRQLLLRRSVPDRQITVTGIPVRDAFSRSHGRNELRDKYGIGRSEFVVLVMGGGLGMIDGDLADWLRSRELPADMRFLVICGRNGRLEQKLREKLAGGQANVTVAGFVEHIDELMALSDLVLTKPGGLTTSEALAMELPMLLLRPLPGQEQDNAAYLVRQGVALEAGESDSLRARLMTLYHNDQLLASMKERARQCAKKQSARSALMKIREVEHKPVHRMAEVPLHA
ncbi:MGDG synthase family glycosyltransferase [Paenibacillus arenilitoris]|uniref:Glycosyltransferase n=1 Tax=Paenibacillus arenilitoris TaxID=2772299 RepID=A0A927CN31_9BACL|nr:glycosyltransferase [Paenibacillus arenilitoris]MBD2869872.1 glycosyltransferase [Paenibacillus arenilitoris]